MASGKIILGMISGEAQQIINESKCGFAVDAGDYKGLAEKADSLSKLSVDERVAMEYAARRYYAENFSKEVLISNLENWMQKLVG